ncbi:MAG: hypothetical protein J6A08_11095 [Lachnospiraceae bacterium]|nr:hypothetical protein [Lachnospiraceae bacterium]
MADEKPPAWISRRLVVQNSPEWRIGCKNSPDMKDSICRKKFVILYARFLFANKTIYSKIEIINDSKSLGENTCSISLYTAWDRLRQAGIKRLNKKAAQELAKCLTHAELCMIGDAGHEVNVDAPERLAEKIVTFIE